MENNKGQTATEYLVILAVVIVVPLIVVGVMGGIPDINSKTSRWDYCRNLSLVFDHYESPNSKADMDFYCKDKNVNNKQDDENNILFVTDKEYQEWKNRSIDDKER